MGSIQQNITTTTIKNIKNAYPWLGNPIILDAKYSFIVDHIAKNIELSDKSLQELAKENTVQLYLTSNHTHEQENIQNITEYIKKPYENTISEIFKSRKDGTYSTSKYKNIYTHDNTYDQNKQYVKYVRLSELLEYSYIKNIGVLDNTELDDSLKKRKTNINELNRKIPNTITFQPGSSCKDIIWSRRDNEANDTLEDQSYNFVKAQQNDEQGMLHSMKITNEDEWHKYKEDWLKNDLLKEYIDINKLGHKDLLRTHRQYVFGLRSNLLPYKLSPKYFRSFVMENPTAEECKIMQFKEDLITWSRKLNHIFTYCSLRNDLIFPVRIIVKSDDNPRKILKIDDNIITENNYYGFIRIRFLNDYKRKKNDKLNNCFHDYFIIKKIVISF
jgi:hypothetical protein